jgi:UrcA family protein
MLVILCGRNGSSRRRALAGAVLFTVAMVGSVAVANAGEGSTERVRIGQFNLDSDAGSRAAFGALASASRRVCRVGESRALSDETRAEACYAEALANAVEAVRNERLTELFRAKGKAG